MPRSRSLVFRFAPSPNGHLHLGHAYSALLNRQLADQAGGRCLLRIEDIDGARCTPRLIADMLEDLAWLGLAWEEPVRCQSAHFSDYGAALDRLAEAGLLYRSTASRGAIAAAVAAAEMEAGRPWPRDPDGAPLYPRHRLAEADPDREPAALRLDMAKAAALAGPLTFRAHDAGRVAAAPLRWGDVVLRRKDIPASYHIAVVVDDALQGVTDVVRGRDLLAATSVHRLLQVLLGLPEPRYHHHDLVLGGDGEKLSKSLASKSLRALRAEGMSAAEVRALVGFDERRWLSTRLHHQRDAVDPHDPHRGAGRQVRPDDAPDRIVDADASRPADDRLGQDEVAPDEGIRPPIEEGLVVAPGGLAPHDVAADDGEGDGQNGEKQHLALPGQAEQDVDEAGRGGGEAEPDQEHARHRELQDHQNGGGEEPGP